MDKNKCEQITYFDILYFLWFFLQNQFVVILSEKDLRDSFVVCTITK